MAGDAVGAVAGGVAVVVLARTSEPPCFSVIDMPASRPVLGQRRRGGRGRRPAPRAAARTAAPARGRAAARGRSRRSSRPGSSARRRPGPRRKGRRRGRHARPGDRLARGPRAGRGRWRCHQLMPGGVELHLIDAVAVAVVGAQPRRVLVGEAAVFLGLLGACQAAEVADARARPSRRPRGAGRRAAPGHRRRRSRPAAAAGWSPRASLHAWPSCQRRLRPGGPPASRPSGTGTR